MKKALIVAIGMMTFAIGQTAFAAANAWPSGPKQVTVGQTFQVVILVNGAKDVDTIRMNGSYSQDFLDWKSAQPTGVFQYVSPGTYVDKAKGVFSFGAFTLNTKANGNSRLAVLTFRAKKVGSAYVQLASSSRVLSAGEEQIGTVGRLNINIVEAKPVPEAEKVEITLFSTTHPDPDTWYANGDVLAGWVIKGKPVKTTYVGFDQSPEGPAELVATTTSYAFEAPYDGVWYIHLGVAFTDKTYQRTDLRVQIDRQPPHPIAPTVDQTGVKAAIKNFLRYGTTDDASGIERYEVTLDGTMVTSTVLQWYGLQGLKPGTHTASVKAYDYAGNNVEGATSFEILEEGAVPKPSWSKALIAALYALFVVLMLLLVFLWDRRRKRSKAHR